MRRVMHMKQFDVSQLVSRCISGECGASSERFTGVVLMHQARVRVRHLQYETYRSLPAVSLEKSFAKRTNDAPHLLHARHLGAP